MEPFFTSLFLQRSSPHVIVIASRGLQASRTSFPVWSFPQKWSRSVTTQQRTHTNCNLQHFLVWVTNRSRTMAVSESAFGTSVLGTGDAFTSLDVPPLGNYYPCSSATWSVSIKDTRTSMEDHDDIIRDSADSEVLKEAFKVVRGLASEISLNVRYFLSQILDPNHQDTQRSPTVAMLMLQFNEDHHRRNRCTIAV